MRVLGIESVFFAYGDLDVLKGVSLSLASGESVAIVGRNGAGKTTLTKLVIGLLHPRNGAVFIGETTTAGKHPEDLADRVGYVFQHPQQQLFARTVLDEVAFAQRQRGRGAAEARDMGLEALGRLGMEACANLHPYDFPPATQKLVTLAAALAQRPQVLVLDEPTQGLDREGFNRVCDVVRAVCDEGVAVLAVSHDLSFVTETMERAAVLVGGRIVAEETVGTLVASEKRVAELGLTTPPSAALSVALGLPGTPVRMRQVAAALSRR